MPRSSSPGPAASSALRSERAAAVHSPASRVHPSERRVDPRVEPRLEAEGQRPPERVARRFRAPEARQRVAQRVPRLGATAVEIDRAAERGHRVFERAAPRLQLARSRRTRARSAGTAGRRPQRGHAAVEVPGLGERLRARHLGRRRRVRVAGQLVQRAGDPIEDPHQASAVGACAGSAPPRPTRRADGSRRCAPRSRAGSRSTRRSA